MPTYLYALLSLFLIISCDKSENKMPEIVSNDAMTIRAELQNDGYVESIVDSIFKQECYFEQWDKTVSTPVSGLIMFHDTDSNWIATIDFGEGACDQWATKLWNVDVFPQHPEGENEFSVFDFYYKKIKK